MFVIFVRDGPFFDIDESEVVDDDFVMIFRLQRGVRVSVGNGFVIEGFSKNSDLFCVDLEKLKGCELRKKDPLVRSLLDGSQVRFGL